MPPRRPGGKYKGAVSRAKGPDTLMKEAEEKRKAALDAHIARLEAKRETDLRAADELKKKQQEQEEATKQRILNFLIGGKKGNAKKFFKAWIVGAQLYKKERKVVQRDKAWRASCSCPDPTCPGGCSSFKALADLGFQLPFDAARKSGKPAFATTGELLWPQPPPLKLPALLGGESPTAKPQGLQTGRSSSLSALTPPRAAESPKCRGLTKPSFWPCRCEKCRGPLPDFIDPANAEVMMHYKSGRRCLVEPQLMRMVFADVTRPHVHGPAAQTVM